MPNVCWSRGVVGILLGSRPIYPAEPVTNHPNPEEFVQPTDCKPHFHLKVFYGVTVMLIRWLIFLVMSCCWRKSANVLVLLDNRPLADGYCTRRSPRKPYWVCHFGLLAFVVKTTTLYPIADIESTMHDTKRTVNVMHHWSEFERVPQDKNKNYTNLMKITMRLII